MKQFSDLKLSDPILKALASEGYTIPTPIQAQAIPPVLEGHDLLGIAQTGTGKTAAFAVPMLDRLLRQPGPRPRKGSRTLILAPTRELASQIAESFRAYGRFFTVSVTTVFGGVPIRRQMKALERGVDVLVATPGRLLDLIDQNALTLQDIEVLVLDEADQMLDLGFIHALRRIVKMLPHDRQTLFFSATMPKSIAELASQYLRDPIQVSVAPPASTAERVEQHAIFVNQAEKQALLTLKTREAEVERALVFTRTKHGADRVVRHLEAAGVNAAAIHGNKSQPQRERSLAAFKSGRCRVLVATDIAARGIDIDNVSHVFNFELPNVPEQYVHRIGRTARAGASGLAVSFVAPDERQYLRAIEKTTGRQIEKMPLPEGFVAQAAELKTLKVAPAPRDDEQPGGRRNGGQRPGGRGGYGGERQAGRPAGRPEGRSHGQSGRPHRDAQASGGYNPAARDADTRPERQPREDNRPRQQDGEQRSSRPRYEERYAQAQRTGNREDRNSAEARPARGRTDTPAAARPEGTKPYRKGSGGHTAHQDRREPRSHEASGRPDRRGPDNRNADARPARPHRHDDAARGSKPSGARPAGPAAAGARPAAAKGGYRPGGPRQQGGNGGEQRPHRRAS